MARVWTIWWNRARKCTKKWRARFANKSKSSNRKVLRHLEIAKWICRWAPRLRRRILQKKHELIIDKSRLIVMNLRDDVLLTLLVKWLWTRCTQTTSKIRLNKTEIAYPRTGLRFRIQLNAINDNEFCQRGVIKVVNLTNVCHGSRSEDTECSWAPGQTQTAFKKIKLIKKHVSLFYLNINLRY